MLSGLRKVADEYNAVLIGETWTDNIDRAEAVLRRAATTSCRCRWI